MVDQTHDVAAVALAAAAPVPPMPSPTAQIRADRTPWMLLISLPATTLAVGLGIAAIDQHVLQNTSREQARQTFITAGRGVVRAAELVLNQAHPLLDHMLASKFTPSDPLATGDRLFDSVIGRPGIAYASISTPEGRFIGIHPEIDGTWLLEHSLIQDDGSSPQQTWQRTPSGSWKLIQDKTDRGYDPRTRPFWRDSISRGRVWTEPYRFWGTWMPGVTCADAIRDGRAVKGVATVDLDLRSLTNVLDQLTALEGTVAFVYTGDATLITMPTGRPLPPLPIDRPLPKATYLKDPILDAFFAKLPRNIPLTELDGRLRQFQVRDESWLAVITPLSVPRGPTWFVGMCVPRGVLLGTADSQARKAWWLAAAASLTAVIATAALARKLSRAREERRSAQAIARLALAEADKAKAELVQLGSYRLRSKLGGGGMGEVWLADHRWLARPAALKLIRRDRTLDLAQAERAREQFLAEARATADLSSRHTVKLYDFGVADDGTFFYAMELLDGLDLNDLVGKHGLLPPGRAIRLVTQACRSLAEAHRHGLVHRDVKPANLFCCRQADEVDICKVLDFGLARTAGRGDGQMQGTLLWMAPEQMEGKALDQRTDLYAIGGVLYWLVTGREPYPRQDYATLTMAKLNHPPEPPSHLLEHALPSGLDELILECLAVDPARRPADANIVMQRLAAIPLDAATDWSPVQAQRWWAALPTRAAADRTPCAAPNDMVVTAFR